MDTQSNVTSTAELESQLGQIILSIEEVVPQRLDNTEAFWFLRGEGKPSSDRYCPFWNGENTSVPERMRGANRGPCRGENTDQHCD